MAKEQILLEYQLVQKGGDKVVSTVTEITEAWDKSGKAATAALSEKQIDAATVKLEKFNVEVEKTSAGFTSAKAQLSELNKQLTSGKLTGKEIEQATKRAADLKREIDDVRKSIGQAASDTRIFDVFVEGGRAVAAAFSVAQGAAALFGEENKDLQKALLKTQGALALLTGAQELARIATDKNGIAMKAYGGAIKVVEGIQKAFAISAAASWAVATAGLTLLVAGVALLISKYSDSDGLTEETKKLNEELERERDILRELDVDYRVATGSIDEYRKSVELLASEFNKKREDVNKQIQEDVKSKTGFFATAIAFMFGGISGVGDKFGEALVESKNKYAPILAALDKQEQERAAILRLKNLDKLAEEEAARLAKINRKKEDEAKRILDLNLANDRLVAEEQRRLEDEFEKRKQKEIDETKAANEKLEQEHKEHLQRIDAQSEEWANKEIQRLNEQTELKKALQDAYFTFASSAASSLNSIVSSGFQQETMNLQREKENQLLLAGDNTKKREAIEKRFAIKQAEIKRKQAIADRVFAVFQIGIATAQAIQKQLAATPLPAGAAFLALIAASAAAQVAAVAAQPLPEIPKFAKGGKINGNPHSMGGVIIEAEGGEFINNTKSTQKYSEELNAANNLELEDLIYHKYLLPALKQAGAADKDGNLYDDWLLRKTIKAGQQADRENSKYIVNGIVNGIRENHYLTQRYLS